MLTVDLELARLREGFPAAPLELNDKPKEKKKIKTQTQNNKKTLTKNKEHPKTCNRTLIKLF